MQVQLLGGVGEHDELTHDLFIVHVTAEGLQFVLQTFLVKVKRFLVVLQLARDDGQVQVDLTSDSIIYFVRSPFHLHDQP